MKIAITIIILVVVGLGAGYFFGYDHGFEEVVDGPSVDTSVEVVSGFNSTSEVRVESVFPCENSDAGEVECNIVQVTVDADDPHSNEDDTIEPVQIAFAVRKRVDVPMTNHWVLFDAGGAGRGYGVTFGSVDPGDYRADSFYGDDLQKWYNDEGFITADILWSCSSKGRNCPGTLSSWLAEQGPGAETWGWTQGLGSDGYAALGSRERAIVEWIQVHNGGSKISAHGHSSGTLRLNSLLTRYDGEELLGSVVFDGGPIAAYSSTNCRGNVGGSVDTDCSSWDDVPASDSLFSTTPDREFDDVSLGVVFGGNDTSNAAPHALLWLGGYDDTPALSADELHVVQGYCDPSSSRTYSFSGVAWPCSDWSESNFPTADSVTYDASLGSVKHATAEAKEGAEALFAMMMSFL